MANGVYDMARLLFRALVPAVALLVAAIAPLDVAFAANPSPQAASQNYTPVQSAPSVQGRPSVNCTCRFQGVDFHVGEMACIRGKRAQCDMVLNNTSWRMLEEPCMNLSGPYLAPDIANLATLR
ncbi:MAG: hypothetical protein AAF638_02395 [Pseudomonadota bacterium]